METAALGKQQRAPAALDSACSPELGEAGELAEVVCSGFLQKGSLPLLVALLSHVKEERLKN